MIPDRERLERLVAEFAPDSKLGRSWELKGGISATTVAFELRHRDRSVETLNYRRPNHSTPEAFGREFRLLQLLHAAGLSVPGPRHLAEDGYVVGYLEGKPELAPNDVSGYLERYATHLAAIHRFPISKIHPLGLPEQGTGIPSVWKAPDESMRETELRTIVGNYGPLRPNRPVLRHGDFWPGNVIWQDGEIAGVIDWEESLIGEPLADLAICRLDLFWTFGWDRMEEFTRLYLSHNALDLKDLPYWDLCTALRPVSNLDAWASSYPPLGRPDVTEATMFRDHAIFVERALARL